MVSKLTGRIIAKSKTPQLKTRKKITGSQSSSRSVSRKRDTRKKEQLAAMPKKVVGIKTPLMKAQENVGLVDMFLDAPEDFNKNAVHACILFADLVGSTEYKIRTENSISGMGKIMLHNKIVEGAIHEYKGVVAKRMGDGILAYFLDNDSEVKDTPINVEHRAIQAGLEIINLIRAENDIRGKQDIHRLQTRIGVHAGNVWMFNWTKTLSKDQPLDPHGPAVDLAAKLCKTAGSNQLVVSDLTFRKAGGSKCGCSSTAAVERQISGVPGLQKIRPVAGRGQPVAPIPSSGDIQPMEEHTAHLVKQVEEGQLQLHKITAPGTRKSKVKELMGICHKILEEDKLNFAANCHLVELILYKIVIIDKCNGVYVKPLNEALKCTGMAIVKYPYSPRPWELRAWVRYQQFLRKTDKLSLLDKAIRHAECASERAERLQIMNELVLAETAHALFIAEKANRWKKDQDKEQSGELLRKAQTNITNIHAIFEVEIENSRGDFYLVKTIIDILNNESVNTVKKSLGKAVKCNTKCVLVADFIHRRISGDPKLEDQYGSIIDSLKKKTR